MNYNPYAAPQAGGLPPTAPQPNAGMPQPWEVGEVLSAAFDAFKVNWVVLVFTPLVGGLIGSVPNVIPVIALAVGAVEQNSPEYWAIYTPCALVGLIINSFFQVGYIKIWLRAARGETPQFGELFEGGSRFLAMVGTTFLLLLITVAFYACFIVPGIIVGLGLCLAPYFVVDQTMGPIDAIKASWKATSGHKGKIFLFGLLGALILIGGCIACVLGIFVAFPVVTVATATIYLRLSGRGGPPRQYGYGQPPPYGAPPPPYGAPPPGTPPPYGGGGPPPYGGGNPPYGGGGPPYGGQGGPPYGGGGYGGGGGGGGYGGPPPR